MGIKSSLLGKDLKRRWLINPLPLIINPPTPLIINAPQIWYTIIYWEYVLLGGWGGLLLGGGDYVGPALRFMATG